MLSGALAAPGRTATAPEHGFPIHELFDLKA